jgi:ribonucleoside-diphosphate reductase alpha chain
MDAFSIAVSVGLQYGVPLEDYVQKFVNMRFEPSGMTSDPDIRFASSLMDYIFRRLALEYLTEEKRAGLGIKSIAERKETAQAVAEEMTGVAAYAEPQPEAAPAAPAEPVAGPTLTANPKPAAPSGMVVDAPLCYSCGSKMQPAGSCYVCSSCGSTSGCS